VIDVLGIEVARAVRVEIPTIHAMSTLQAWRTVVALGPLRTRVALRPLGTNVAPITLGTLGTDVSRVTAIAVRTPAIVNVAGTVPIHVFGGQVTLAILVQIPALEAVGTLWTGVALGANGTSVTLGTLRARIARVALRPERTGRAVIPALTFGAARAVRTSTVLRVAGAV